MRGGENMRKWTIEDEMRFLPFIEEAERDIKENGTITWEELTQRLEEYERREGLYINKKMNKRQNIKLNLARCFGKISRRFVRIVED